MAKSALGKPAPQAPSGAAKLGMPAKVTLAIDDAIETSADPSSVVSPALPPPLPAPVRPAVASPTLLAGEEGDDDYDDSLDGRQPITLRFSPAALQRLIELEGVMRRSGIRARKASRSMIAEAALTVVDVDELRRHLRSLSRSAKGGATRPGAVRRPS